MSYLVNFLKLMLKVEPLIAFIVVVVFPIIVGVINLTIHRHKKVVNNIGLKVVVYSLPLYFLYGAYLINLEHLIKEVVGVYLLSLAILAIEVIIIEVIKGQIKSKEDSLIDRVIDIEVRKNALDSNKLEEEFSRYENSKAVKYFNNVKENLIMPSIDVSHAKHLIELVSQKDLTGIDKLKLERINYTLNKDSGLKENKEELNEELNNLLKLVAKYKI